MSKQAEAIQKAEATINAQCRVRNIPRLLLPSKLPVSLAHCVPMATKDRDGNCGHRGFPPKFCIIFQKAMQEIRMEAIPPCIHDLRALSLACLQTREELEYALREEYPYIMAISTPMSGLVAFPIWPSLPKC